MILIKSDPSASVAVNIGRDSTVFVNPYSGELLGGSSATREFTRRVVDWHRWLAVEGEGRATARSITGACNLAFLWLAVTGVYFWWPRNWTWRALKTSLLFNARLRGNARHWNYAKPNAFGRGVERRAVGKVVTLRRRRMKDKSTAITPHLVELVALVV